MHTDRCGNTCRQKCCAKGSGKEVKIQEFMYRDTTNVEPEMYDYTNNNWSHWNSDEKLNPQATNVIYIYINIYIYMKLLVKPEMLTSYIYMDVRLATLKQSLSICCTMFQH